MNSKGVDYNKSNEIIGLRVCLIVNHAILFGAAGFIGGVTLCFFIWFLYKDPEAD